MMIRRHGLLWLAMAMAMTGCDEEASIGERDAAMPTPDAAMVGDAGTPRFDASTIDAAMPLPDAAVIAPPAFLDIAVSSSSSIDLVSEGSALVPRALPTQSITVTASTTRTSVTTHPTGTLGGCDLFPPIGAGSWPPATVTEGTPALLPLEYVTITADGVAVAMTAMGTQGVAAHTQLAPGAHFVVTVRYPGHAAIVRELDLEAPLALSSPTVQPSVDRVLAGRYVAGADLTLSWPVDHAATAREIVDVFGTLGAVRCSQPHGTGMVTLSAADVRSGLLGTSGTHLGVSLYATSSEDMVVETTTVGLRRSWSLPSIGLDP